MTSEQNVNAAALKHQVYLRRKRQAGKAEGFLLLTWWGFIASLAWGTGTGYEVAETLGLLASENIDVVALEALGSLLIGGISILFLKPFTFVLRHMMVARPETPDDDEYSETAVSRQKTAIEVLAVAAALIGIPSAFYITSTVIANELVQLAGTMCGFFFWVLAISCFVQARRNLKRYLR